MIRKHAAGSMQPIVFGILARLTPPDMSVQLFDENVEDIPMDVETNLVAMSVHTFNARRAYALADVFRHRGIPVVLGGVHPTLLPAEALEHADAIVVGDAEHVWPQLLADLTKHKMQKVYSSADKKPHCGMTPDRTLFRNKRYCRLTPVQFGRGCIFRCDFCAAHIHQGSRVRHRPVEEVLAEISSLRRDVIFFVDDNLCSFGNDSIRLLRGLSELRVSWVGQISMNALIGPEMVRLLKESGCMALFVGFESLVNTNLQTMNKLANINRDYRQIVSNLQRHGIMVAGSFIFGYDGDRSDSINAALSFSKEANLVLAHFNPIFAAPETLLYKRLVAEGRLLDPYWWNSEKYHYGMIPFEPKGMSAVAIENGCFAARRSFNTFGSIWRRAFGSRANWFPPKKLGLFLAANIVSRHEIYRKQGAKLG